MTTSESASPPAAAPAAAGGGSTRKQALLGLTAAVAAAAVGFGAYEWFVARHYESTDNAYVQGSLVQVTPAVGGTVVAIDADDTDFVKAGATLVAFDPADAQLALDAAAANLAQTVRQTRGLFDGNTVQAANLAQRNADVARLAADLARREQLAASGAVSAEELAHLRSALDAARAAQQAAVAQLASGHALTDGTAVANHPNVLAARARYREAALAAARTRVPAPVDGYVARRTVQLGQRVAAGTPLMAVVPLDQIWVDANFKEVQLRDIRVGQPVTLTSDVWGGGVVYHGKVVGLGSGTGAAFALLPAQNATGNWIKVVQRVPVRIALQPDEIKRHPLRIGLSMDAKVDVSDHSGPALSTAASRPLQTQAVAADVAQIDAAAQQIIAANLASQPAKR